MPARRAKQWESAIRSISRKCSENTLATIPATMQRLFKTSLYCPCPARAYLDKTRLFVNTLPPTFTWATYIPDGCLEASQVMPELRIREHEANRSTNLPCMSNILTETSWFSDPCCFRLIVTFGLKGLGKTHNSIAFPKQSLSSIPVNWLGIPREME